MESPENRSLPQESTKEIEKEEISCLREPIMKLLEQLRENIDQSKYSMLIGDDASGRIPTLIFRKILGELYKSSDEKTPETLFIAGSGSSLSKDGTIQGEKLTQKIQSIMDLLRSHPPKKRILLITDTIYTGASLRPLLKSLNELGYSFDVATIGTKEDDEKNINELLSSISHEFGCEIFKGMEGMPKPGIYYKHAESGVVKNPEDLHSIQLKKSTNDNIQKWVSIGKSQEAINQARKDVDTIAQELTKWYKS